MHFYIPSSLLHFDIQLNNSQSDPTEKNHLKGMVTLLVGEKVQYFELHIKVR